MNGKSVWVLEELDTWDNPIYVFLGVFSTDAKAAEWVLGHRYNTFKHADGSEYQIEREFHITEHKLDEVKE